MAKTLLTGELVDSPKPPDVSVEALKASEDLRKYYWQQVRLNDCVEYLRQLEGK
jgi:hypothetical protein